VSGLHCDDNRVVRWRHAYPDVNSGQIYAYTTASADSAEAAPEPATSHNTRTATTFATPYCIAATHPAASTNTGAHSIFATPHSSTAAIVLS
jgi:hypothetical protein